jgi:N-acetylmuramoyl-L-alanine amidase
MKRKIKQIVVHHSASPRETTTVNKIITWHKNKGWDHIGYHRVVGRDGTVAATLSLEKEGYHVWGRNKHTVGICVVGNFEQEHPTQQQLDNLEGALASLCKKLELPAEKIFGHRALALPFHGTACPGKNLFILLSDMRKRIKKKLEA